MADVETKKHTTALVALDESEESVYALKWALEHVLHEGDPLFILNSQPLPPSYLEAAPIFGAGAIVLPELIDSYRKQQDYITNGIFTKAQKLCEGYKNAVTTLVMQGDPRESICEAVVKHGADVLVMGNHGYGTFKRTFLGSVSDYCVHNAKCPVLIVKKEKEAKKN